MNMQKIIDYKIIRAEIIRSETPCIKCLPCLFILTSYEEPLFSDSGFRNNAILFSKRLFCTVRRCAAPELSFRHTFTQLSPALSFGDWTIQTFTNEESLWLGLFALGVIHYLFSTTV